jgi:hypothetical protein
MDMSVIEDRKTRARAWFEALRNDICAAFERLEDDAPASLYPGEAGRFVRTPWDRTDHSGAKGGGGVMSIMRAECSRGRWRRWRAVVPILADAWIPSNASPVPGRP